MRSDKRSPAQVTRRDILKLMGAGAAVSVLGPHFLSNGAAADELPSQGKTKGTAGGHYNILFT